MSYYSPDSHEAYTDAVAHFLVGAAVGAACAFVYGELRELENAKGSLNISLFAPPTPSNIVDLLNNEDLAHLNALDHYGPSPYKMACGSESQDLIYDLRAIFYAHRDQLIAALEQDSQLSVMVAQSRPHLDYNAIIQNAADAYVYCPPSDSNDVQISLLSYAHIENDIPSSFSVNPAFFQPDFSFCHKLDGFLHAAAHGYLGTGHFTTPVDGVGPDLASSIGVVAGRYCTSANLSQPK